MYEMRRQVIKVKVFKDGHGKKFKIGNYMY